MQTLILRKGIKHSFFHWSKIWAPLVSVVLPLSKMVHIPNFGYLPVSSVCWYHIHIQITFVKSSVADIGYLASTIQYCYYSPIEKKTNVIQLQYIYSWMIPLWNTFKCFSDTIVIFMTHNRYTVVSKIAQFSPAGRLDLPLNPHNSFLQIFYPWLLHW